MAWRNWGELERIKLKDLEKEFYRLQFLVDTYKMHAAKEMEVFVKAGEIVGLLYDAFQKEFKDPESDETRRMRKTLIELFRVLNQKEEESDPCLDDDLAAFPYVNGGLFMDEDIEVPQFTDEIRTLLLDKALADFDWSQNQPNDFRGCV